VTVLVRQNRRKNECKLRKASAYRTRNGVSEEKNNDRGSTRKEKVSERKEGKKFSYLGSLCEYFYNKNKTPNKFTVCTEKKEKKGKKKRKRIRRVCVCVECGCG
jgi:hypothetical protein